MREADELIEKGGPGYTSAKDMFAAMGAVVACSKLNILERTGTHDESFR